MPTFLPAAMTRALVLLFAIIAAGCSATQSLTSRAPSGEIIIDAEVADWEGNLSPVDGEAFSLGVYNDLDNLYIALVTHDQQVTTQILLQGLTFWVDPDGGKDKTVGLRYPTGLMGIARSRGGRNPGGAPVNMQVAAEQTFNHFEIVRGEDVLRHPINSLPNVNARASMEYGTLTLEVRIPLTSDTHFALGAPVENAIGLGLETAPRSLDDLRQGLGDAGSARGRGTGAGGRARGGDFAGGRQGGFAGGRAASARGQGPVLQEQLKLWMTVTLAR